MSCKHDDEEVQNNLRPLNNTNSEITSGSNNPNSYRQPPVNARTQILSPTSKLSPTRQDVSEKSKARLGTWKKKGTN